MKAFKKTSLANCINLALIMGSITITNFAAAEKTPSKNKVVGLEIIQVTARKRTENIKDVPISVSALTSEKLGVLGSSGMDIRSLSARVPSLLIESSFGRTFPRFYIRGLGNTDFDLLASQPVSLVYDGVVLENALTKGFPMFDIERVEVLRGPQGTLFGRNTTAGIIKVTSKKPTQDFDLNMSGSFGTHDTSDLRFAMGGGLTDTLSARVAFLQQNRNNWISNEAPGFKQKNQLGGYGETAGRIQLLWQPIDEFKALFNYHFYRADGNSRIFRANIIKKGTNDLVDNYDPKVVYQDAASRNKQTVSMHGASLKLSYDLGDYTLTSISGYESANIFSVGDIDGGYGASFLPYMGPGFIPFPSETGAKMPAHKQITQEVRIATNNIGPLDYQFGYYYFNEQLTINNISFNTLNNGKQNGIAIQNMDTTAWAVFGSVDYELSDKATVTGGLRYSDDKRAWDGTLVQSPFGAPGFSETKNVRDSQFSGDLSLNYHWTDNTNLYGRFARGYRAPSIQGRSLLFSAHASTAKSETVDSIETGFKSTSSDNMSKLNGSVFYFNVHNQQLSAVGGTGNVTSLLNADKTVGYGFELESEVMLTDNLLITSSVSYNSTELQDKNISVAPCGGGCTVTSPLNSAGRAIINGDPLPQSPKWIGNLTAQWSHEVGNGEFFVYTDWSYRSEVNFFLYESKEFIGKPLLEGGLRTGYRWDADGSDYEIALFSRNITNTQRLTGAIDFNNLTGYVNEPRFWGVEFKANYF